MSESGDRYDAVLHYFLLLLLPLCCRPCYRPVLEIWLLIRGSFLGSAVPTSAPDRQLLCPSFDVSANPTTLPKALPAPAPPQWLQTPQRLPRPSLCRTSKPTGARALGSRWQVR